MFLGRRVFIIWLFPGAIYCWRIKYYVILTVHDISKERVLKSSLQHSNEKFLCFFDNVTVGCAICDKDGKLVEVNDTYVRYMGTTSKNEAVNQLNIYTNPCINPEFKEIMKAGVPRYRRK